MQEKLVHWLKVSEQYKCILDKVNESRKLFEKLRGSIEGKMLESYRTADIQKPDHTWLLQLLYYVMLCSAYHAMCWAHLCREGHALASEMRKVDVYDAVVRHGIRAGVLTRPAGTALTCKLTDDAHDKLRALIEGADKERIVECQ